MIGITFARYSYHDNMMRPLSPGGAELVRAEAPNDRVSAANCWSGFSLPQRGAAGHRTLVRGGVRRKGHLRPVRLDGEATAEPEGRPIR